MDGRPVTVRLIDPPLHEFVPKTREQAAELSRQIGITPETILARAEQLHESNPMLGHRGCRLMITYPEILEMQVRAIIEAAIEVQAPRHQGRARDHDPADDRRVGARRFSSTACTMSPSRSSRRPASS
jgi:phosphoenolpyruvate synthase/pyruvate phosphate dikinase